MNLQSFSNSSWPFIDHTNPGLISVELLTDTIEGTISFTVIFATIFVIVFYFYFESFHFVFQRQGNLLLLPLMALPWVGD
jgi:hypothetical protein